MNARLETAPSGIKQLVPHFIKQRWRDWVWRHGSLPFLPLTSRAFGPPRRWVHLTDYLQRHPGAMREVLPGQLLPEPEVNCIGPVAARFFSRMEREIPPASIVELPGVRLLGPDGWIVGARDSLILDTSYHAYWDQGMTADDHWILKRRLALPVRRLPGRTLSLASDFVAGSYAHFVQDSLCRLLLLERGGMDPGGFDQIYWPRLSTAGAARLVAASGLPAEKIISDDPRFDLECDSLTATTFPGRPAHLTPPYCDFLRRRFAPAPLGSGRRLYLSRRGYSRQIVNYDAIERILLQHDYEICQPDEDPEILAKCAAAAQIVTTEGAGFYNAFAAPPGTRVLIILPESGQTLPYNQVLALSCGHQLSLMMAASVPVAARDANAGDMHVDPELFVRGLAALEAAP